MRITVYSFRLFPTPIPSVSLMVPCPLHFSIFQEHLGFFIVIQLKHPLFNFVKYEMLGMFLMKVFEILFVNKICPTSGNETGNHCSDACNVTSRRHFLFQSFQCIRNILDLYFSDEDLI